MSFKRLLSSSSLTFSIALFLHLKWFKVYFLLTLATTALRASAARSGSERLEILKLDYETQMSSIVIEDRYWGGGAEAEKKELTPPPLPLLLSQQAT